MRKKNSTFLTLKEVIYSVQSMSRLSVSNDDLCRIQALVPDFYEIRYMKQKKGGHKVKELGLSVTGFEGRSISSRLLAARKLVFRRQLEEIVLKAHSEFTKHSKEYQDIRKSQKFHPDFKLQSLVKTKLKMIPLPKLTEKINQSAELTAQLVKGTRLNNRAAVETLSGTLTENELKLADKSIQKAMNSVNDATKNAKPGMLTPNTRKKILDDASPSMRHLSPTLLLKLKANEKVQTVIKVDPKITEEKKRWEDCIYVMSLIRTIFNSSRKTSMPFAQFMDIVTKRHKRRLTRQECKTRLEMLSGLCPEFFVSMPVLV
eukprot:UN02441